MSPLIKMLLSMSYLCMTSSHCTGTLRSLIYITDIETTIMIHEELSILHGSYGHIILAQLFWMYAMHFGPWHGLIQVLETCQIDEDNLHEWRY